MSLLSFIIGYYLLLLLLLSSHNQWTIILIFIIFIPLKIFKSVIEVFFLLFFSYVKCFNISKF